MLDLSSIARPIDMNPRHQTRDGEPEFAVREAFSRNCDMPLYPNGLPGIGPHTIRCSWLLPKRPFDIVLNGDCEDRGFR